MSDINYVAECGDPDCVVQLTAEIQARVDAQRDLAALRADVERLEKALRTDPREVGRAAVTAYLVRPIPAGCEPAKAPDGFRSWSKKRQEEWIDGQARATVFAQCADQDDALEAAGKAALSALSAQPAPEKPALPSRVEIQTGPRDMPKSRAEKPAAPAGGGDGH